MLFLHGSGERGTNLAKVAVHGPPKIVKAKRDFPFILVSPQCPAGSIWSDEAVLALLDEIQEKYRVDLDRVYLTGLSMGGYGTWSLGMKYPDRFAAIAPICGGGSILDVLLVPAGKAGALKRLPVWAFHGAKDNVVPLEQSEDMINALKKAGNQNTKLTVYPEAGHDSWTEAYNSQELYDWSSPAYAREEDFIAERQKAWERELSNDPFLRSGESARPGSELGVARGLFHGGHEATVHLPLRGDFGLVFPETDSEPGEVGLRRGRLSPKLLDARQGHQEYRPGIASRGCSRRRHHRRGVL
jgi:hypothetical protein